MAPPVDVRRRALVRLLQPLVDLVGGIGVGRVFERYADADGVGRFAVRGPGGVDLFLIALFFRDPQDKSFGFHGVSFAP